MDAEMYRRNLLETPISPTFAKHTYERRGAEHFEELEARWKNPLRSEGFRSFVHKVRRNLLPTTDDWGVILTASNRQTMSTTRSLQSPKRWLL